MAVKHFDTAARQGEAALPNDTIIKFTIDEHECTAHPPTAGQLALFTGGGDGLAGVQAMFEFLDVILDETDADFVREKLQEGVDLAMVTDIVQYLIGEWSARPTQPSSGSSPTQKRTGSKSTAKPRSKAKT